MQEKVNIKIGDRLYCHSLVPNIYFGKTIADFTVGKYYIITYIFEIAGFEEAINDGFFSVDDDNGQHFTFDKYGKHSFKNYFYTEIEARKLKLDKLNENI